MTPAAVGQRCPEHSGKPQGIQKVTRAAERAVTGVGARRVNTVTMVLIGINVLVYLAELGAGGTIQGTSNWIYQRGALIASGNYFQGQLIPTGFVPGPEVGVAHGEWWRLITSAFLHYGPFHLAVNMYSLFFAGSILEHVIDRWRFAVLYLVSGLAGAAGALVWKPDAATVGASGAIFGILGALFVLERRGNIATGGQIAGLIILNLVITFYWSSSISVGGHVGGLIGGVVLMFAFLQFRRSAPLTIASAAAVAAVAVAVAYAAV